MKTYLGRAVGAAVLVILSACATQGASRTAQDIPIDDRDVYPESLSSTRDGTLYVGSIKGIVYRARPGDAKATAWVRPDAANGLLAVYGVLAHEPSRTLWLCSVPNAFAPPVPDAATTLVALDLATGAPKGRYVFPGARSVCNDMTVAADGSVYATDTSGGRLLRLRKGVQALDVYAEGDALKGADGIAFDAKGRLYVNIVTTGGLLRVEPGPAGRGGRLVPITVDAPLGGPDGMRLVTGSRFLLAEGTTGRIDELVIDGDKAHVRVLREGLNSSPGVTPVGGTAYAIEGKIRYLIDPKLKGQDPGPFVIRAIPLN
jgi:sugar lactone lactonase YvrE